MQTRSAATATTAAIDAADAVDMYADGGVHGKDGRNDAHALEDVAARRVHPDMDHIEIAPVERRELLGEIVAVHPRADCAVKPHYGFPRRLVYGIYVRFFPSSFRNSGLTG